MLYWNFLFQQETLINDFTQNDEELVFDCSYKCILKTANSPWSMNIVDACIKVSMKPIYRFDTANNLVIIVNFNAIGNIQYIKKVNASSLKLDGKGLKITFEYDNLNLVTEQQTEIPELSKLLTPYKTLLAHFFINIYNSFIVFFTPLKNEE